MATGFPSEYYDFLNGDGREEPDWAKRYPEQWETACDETRQLTLGTSASTAFLTVRLPQLREQFGDRLVLLGGPPCQSYSLVGRARNAGNADYDASKDKRQLLYQEYVRALRELQPAIAIMENVKGVLSAKHNDKPIFRHILQRLKNPGGGGGARSAMAFLP
ncbi:DNA cytosine methyltransferase [Candidatus Palauibacter sp.]|uniref:DNA cytosine methyltransferase n=1 Tax=Candidatus Palauibacter sp. TaxID=3101350 RepID=UPI003B59682C